jgi:hypothetical protein
MSVARPDDGFVDLLMNKERNDHVLQHDFRKYLPA